MSGIKIKRSKIQFALYNKAFRKSKCHDCKHCVKEGRGESWYGYREYYTDVCELVIDDEKDHMEIVGPEHLSSPDKVWKNGYMEIVTICNKWKTK